MAAPEPSAATRAEFDYTDEELARARPLTPNVVSKIRDRCGLMRWCDHEWVAGSLADEFWNKDLPRLLALAEKAVKP